MMASGPTKRFLIMPIISAPFFTLQNKTNTQFENETFLPQADEMMEAMTSVYMA
jgi:hypothetical protein